MNEKFTYLDIFPKNTVLKQYLAELERICDVNTNENFKKYSDIVSGNSKIETPFLSVVIRTQGKREDGLRESLLCMSAQSNQNFEILLIGHKLGSTQKKLVEEILSEQSDELRNKIRFLELNEGTRTAPLNFGMAHACGKYVAFFDDDDILFANWVESFEACAKDNEGRILHAFAFAQNWKNIPLLGYCSESAPQNSYCQKFDLISQLTVNRCPLMTIAFPTYLFQKLGIMFNEELNVTEDWEYFMRVAFICGVTDICVPTAIYRFWENIETSATLHNQKDWTSTYKKIQDSFNAEYSILPPDNIHKIIGLIEKHNTSSSLQSDAFPSSRFYFSRGNSFNDIDCIKSVSDKPYPEFDLWFLFVDKTKDLCAMRFDLCEEGMFILKDIAIDVWLTNGEKEKIQLRDCVHNGISYKGSILFLHEDPEIVWEWNDERFVDVIHISGSISRNIPRFKWLNRIESLFTWKEKGRKKDMNKKGYF